MKALFSGSGILALLNALVALGCAGVFAYGAFFFKRPLPQNAEEFQNLKQEARSRTQVPPVEIKKMTINLYSNRNKLRFLDIQVNLLPFGMEDISFIKDNESILRDVIIDIVGDMEEDELTSVSGKILLEKRIIDGFNERVRRKAVKKLFFSTFVLS